MTAYGEKEIKLAARMYEIRDTARKFYGDRYAGTMRQVGAMIEGIARRDKVSTLEAATSFAKEAFREGDEVSVMLITAAAVELLESTS